MCLKFNLFSPDNIRDSFLSFSSFSLVIAEYTYRSDGAKLKEHIVFSYKHYAPLELLIIQTPFLKSVTIIFLEFGILKNWGFIFHFLIHLFTPNWQSGCSQTRITNGYFSCSRFPIPGIRYLAFYSIYG